MFEIRKRNHVRGAAAMALLVATVWLTPSARGAPTVPARVIANPSAGSVTLTWLPVPGATQYNVYRAGAPGVTAGSTGLAGYTATTGLALNTHTAGGLGNGQPYYFVVTAVDATGESGESAEVLAVPSATVDAAKAGVNALFSQLGSIVNTQGANLSYTHLLPLMAAGHLHEGYDATQSAKRLASELRGGTVGAWTLSGVAAYDTANLIITPIGDITFNGANSPLDARDDGQFVLKSDDGGSTWKMFGNQRIARTDTSITMRIDRGPGNNQGPRQNVNFAVEAPQGTVLSATVAGPGIAGTLNMPANTPLVETVVGDPAQPAGESFIRDTFYVYFDPPSSLGNNLSYTYVLTRTAAAGGGTVTYSVPFTRGVVSDAVNGSISMVSPTGHALADATLGVPLPLNWSLPTAFTLTEVRLSGTVSSVGFACRFADQSLLPTANSGTVTFPTQCNGQPTVKASINLAAIGSADERALLIYEMYGGGGYATAPAITAATVGDGQVTITFSAPASDGGSPITSYQVTCDPGLHVASGTASPVTVGGLSNGSTYACRVAAVNVIGVGNASSPVNLTPGGAPALLGMYSRRQHASAGNFDLPIKSGIPVGGPVTVEPRRAAGDHVIVFRFNLPVGVAGTAAAFDTADAPIGSATTQLSGKDVLVNLSGIADGRRIKVTLSGTNGGAGPAVNSVATIGFLVGDVSGNGAVSIGDVTALKARTGQLVNFTNYLYDINLSGGISASDVLGTKLRNGGSLQ